MTAIDTAYNFIAYSRLGQGLHFNNCTHAFVSYMLTFDTSLDHFYANEVKAGLWDQVVSWTYLTPLIDQCKMAGEDGVARINQLKQDLEEGKVHIGQNIVSNLHYIIPNVIAVGS